MYVNSNATANASEVNSEIVELVLLRVSLCFLTISESEILIIEINCFCQKLGVATNSTIIFTDILYPPSITNNWTLGVICVEGLCGAYQEIIFFNFR